MENKEISSILENKKILITGGTGSLGKALTQKLLSTNVGQIRIFSRNEFKQLEMESVFKDERLRFLIGDVRDLPRLELALDGIDYVFHAAALKHVPKIEYNPFEAIKTNVIGSQNVIDACVKAGVKKAVCIGTDKAVSPLNTYGATKLLMEKLFVTANNYLNPNTNFTKFIAVRYGNVLGSSGSVIPKFIQQIKNKQKITITDPKMTRFSITMDEALELILNALYHGKGKEIFVPKIKAYEINTLKEALFDLLENTGEEITGIRPGEKINEILINNDEIKYTWEFQNMYMILNLPEQENLKVEIIKSYPNISPLTSMTLYSSDNVEKISTEEIKNKVIESKLT